MTSKSERALALIRVVVGLTFLAHGSQKFFQFGIHGVAGAFAQGGIPMPLASAYLATFAEFFGGLFLLLGLLTRLAAIPVAVTMVVAILKVHLKGGFFLPTGFEYALVLLVANAAFILAGGGAWALDNVLFHSKSFGRAMQKSA